MSRAAAVLRLRGRAWRLPRPPLRATLAVLVAATVLGGAWLWFRDSSFVRVEDVFITGVTSAEESRIRSVLRAAARDMTTLHVREDALREAVAPFASVRDLRVDPGFPHKLTIEVIESGAVAALVVDGHRLAVADDGRVLRGGRVQRGLTTIRVQRSPGTRVRDRRTLATLTVLGAAPHELRRRATRAWYGSRGLTLDLRAGPDLIFGSSERARAKWLAAARVLADSSAEGAAYLDLRVPERVAAGGLAPLEDETEEGELGAQGAGQAGAGQAEAGEPGATQPGAAQPGATQPEAAQPEATQPGATQPGAAQPEAGPAGAGQANGGQPAQPEAAQPGAAQPGVTAPEAGQAGAAAPAAGPATAAQPTAEQPAQGAPVAPP